MKRHPERLLRLGSLVLVVLAFAASFLALGRSEGVQVHAQTNPNSLGGALANSCGLPQPEAGISVGPPPAAGRGTPIFPAGQYPVKLPMKSLLGAPNERAGLPNPYQSGVVWGELPAGRKWGSTASVTTGPDGHIWVVDRCSPTTLEENCSTPKNIAVNPIFEFEPSGKLLKNFGAGLFTNPHKMSVDQNGFLWVADNSTHLVTKLDRDGKVLMTLGKKGQRGPGLDEFDAPTQVAVAPNGDIFVTDGHSGGGGATGNARIMKFNKEGKFLKTWGRKGMDPSEFDVLHDIVLDSRGRLFVADRQNNRIQIFDQEGKFIDMWYQFGRPSGIYIDKRNDTIYVADSESRDARTNIGQLTLSQTAYAYNLGAQRGIRIGSARDGKVTAFIPDPCPYPYPTTSSLAEGIAADLDGNVYGADYLMAVRKFVKK